MAYKAITLREQEYIPQFDKDNTKDPVRIYYKPLTKENYDRYMALVRVSLPGKDANSDALAGYDAAKANKFLWDMSISRIDNVAIGDEGEFKTISSKEELSQLYEKADRKLLDEILAVIVEVSTLTGAEIKNSALAQGSSS